MATSILLVILQKIGGHQLVASLRNQEIETDKTERQNGIDFIEEFNGQNGKR